MASWQESVDRADANLSLADRLAGMGEYNWAIVVCFYSAVHNCNALIGRHPGRTTDDLDHQYRKQLLDDYQPAVAQQYRGLLGASIAARYLATSTADEERFRRLRRKAEHVRDYTERVGRGEVAGIP